MTTVYDAVHMIRTLISKKERDIYRDRITAVNTDAAHGKILANNIISPLSIPSYKSSTKHGYAVVASDGKGMRKVLATFDKVKVTEIRLMNDVPNNFADMDGPGLLNVSIRGVEGNIRDREGRVAR